MCFFHYKHEDNHKVIDINEIKSLEDNNISYKNTVSEFDKIFKKMNNIKKNIEIEIEKISNSRDILLGEITSSFEEQRKKLNEKEKSIKIELDKKVTEIKENLENYYLNTNDILTSSERIFKAIQNYDKKDNNNQIKTLCYISTINKINTNALNIIKKPFENIEISFINENYDNNLNYKNYYVNGIPIPKDIKVEQTDNNKLSISWSIDNLYLDDKKYKYLIILKDDKTKEKYESVITNIVIQNIKLDTNYEIQICTLIDDINGDWSDIKKLKTKKIIFQNKAAGSPLFGNIFNQNNNDVFKTGNLFGSFHFNK